MGVYLFNASWQFSHNTGTVVWRFASKCPGLTEAMSAALSGTDRQNPPLNPRQIISLDCPSLSDGEEPCCPLAAHRLAERDFSFRLDYCPNLFRYSMDSMKARTISACWKFPLNWFSFPSQN